MNAIIRAMFYRMPAVGDVYEFDEADPWDRPRVTVIEVRDGWVRFRTQRADVRSLARSSFHSCYRRATQAEGEHDDKGGDTK